jgi:hypothetical protein
VTTTRRSWRPGLEILEIALFVSTLIGCAFSLFVHPTPTKSVRIFDRALAIGLVDATTESGNAWWTRGFDGGSPDSSDDDDDDDDDSSVSAELPHRFQAAPCQRVAAVSSVEMSHSSDVTSRAQSLRAPPASSL